MLIACAIYDLNWDKIHEYNHITWYEKFLYYNYDFSHFKEQIEKSHFGMARYHYFDLYTMNNGEYIGFLACKNYDQKIAKKFLHDYLEHKKIDSWIDIYQLLDQVGEVKQKIEELKETAIENIDQILDQGVKMEDLIHEAEKIDNIVAPFSTKNCCWIL